MNAIITLIGHTQRKCAYNCTTKAMADVKVNEREESKNLIETSNRQRVAARSTPRSLAKQVFAPSIFNESSSRCALDSSHPTVSLRTGRRAQCLSDGSDSIGSGGGYIENKFSRLTVVRNRDGAARQINHALCRQEWGILCKT